MENPTLNEKFEDISENLDQKQKVTEILNCIIEIISNDSFYIDVKIILFLEVKRNFKISPQILPGNVLVQIIGFDPLKYFFNSQSSTLLTEALIQSYWKLIATITQTYHSYLFENGFNCIHDFRGVFEDENGIKLITKIGNLKRIAQNLCGHILRKLLLANNYYWIIPKQISKIIFGRKKNNHSYHFFCFYLNYYFILKYNFQKIPTTETLYSRELNQIVDEFSYNTLDDSVLLTLINNINGLIKSIKQFIEQCRPIVDSILNNQILNPFWKTKFQKDKQQKILIGYQKMIYDAIDSKDIHLLLNIFYDKNQNEEKFKVPSSLYYLNLNDFIWIDENLIIDMWINFQEQFQQEQFGQSSCCLTIINLFYSLYTSNFSQQIKIEYMNFIEKQLSLNNLLFTEKGHNLIQQVTFINYKELSMRRSSYVYPILEFLYQVIQDEKIFSTLSCPDLIYEFIVDIFNKINESTQVFNQTRSQKGFIDYEITHQCLKIMNQLNCLVSHQPFKQFLTLNLDKTLSRLQNSINISSDDLCVLKFVLDTNTKEKYNLEFRIKSEWILKQLHLIPLKENLLENLSWITLEFQYFIQLLKQLLIAEGKTTILDSFIQLYRYFKQELRIFPQTKQLFILPLIIEQIKIYDFPDMEGKIKYYINLINLIFEDLQTISKLQILNMIVQNIGQFQLRAISVLIFFFLDREKIIRKRVRQIKSQFQDYFFSLEEFHQINSINFFLYLLFNILPYQKTPIWKKTAYLFRHFCGFFVNIGKTNIKRQAYTYLYIKHILNGLNNCKAIPVEQVNFNIQLPMLDESKEFKTLQQFPQLKDYEDSVCKPVNQTEIINFLLEISEEFFRVKRKGILEYFKQSEQMSTLIDKELFQLKQISSSQQ